MIYQLERLFTLEILEYFQRNCFSNQKLKILVYAFEQTKKRTGGGFRHKLDNATKDEAAHKLPTYHNLLTS